MTNLSVYSLVFIGCTDEEIAPPFVSLDANYAVAEDEQEKVSHVCRDSGLWPQRGRLRDRCRRQRSCDFDFVVMGFASGDGHIHDGRDTECFSMDRFRFMRLHLPSLTLTNVRRWMPLEFEDGKRHSANCDAIPAARAARARRSILHGEIIL